MKLKLKLICENLRHLRLTCRLRSLGFLLLIALGIFSGRHASGQFWFGSPQVITNFTASSCVATTYTTISFPGAQVQLTITNGNTQMTNGFSSSFGQGPFTISNTVPQLPSVFNAGGVTATTLAPWTTNINYPPTNIVVPIYWYFTTQPMLYGLGVTSSNYSLQAQP